jgi:endonuclease YncB( thermonuclease family)
MGAALNGTPGDPSAYVAADAEARAAKGGVWQGEFEMPWDFRARLSMW